MGLASRMPITETFRSAASISSEMQGGRYRMACVGGRKSQHDARGGQAGGLAAPPPPGGPR